METEHWQRIEAIFHAALARDRAGWEEFVRQECSGDELLQQEVLSLLAESDSDESFLEDPAMRIAARALAGSSKAAGLLPAFIGRYRIIRLVGEGGMGAVYEAEQEEPRRIVALKMIRPGLATPERLRRFRHESEALGRLQHPGIAQIYEASTADAGFGPQPYFAMELIRGEPLDRYAETHQFSVRQKLALMAKICEAVHHAHQRGLIHRDLKPGNILVDEEGQPKILDFGVARVTEDDAQFTLQTEVGQIIGTLAYMSPEQVLGDSLEIDTRSDVYSLGVILYELLAGRAPYATSGRQIQDALHAIRETDPAPLGAVNRAFRGDIETIVGKALEKDKTRRYASAAALAADIEHYLNDEPILARPPSATYQFSKFARRHRVAVGAAAALVLMLAAFSVVQAIALVRITRERDRATRITDFMTGMFKVSDPSQARGNSVTAREILDRASSDIGTGLSKDPEVQAQMMQVMATTYLNLGLYPRARDLAQQALDARRKILPPDDPGVLQSMTQLGWILDRDGHYSDAEKLERQALEQERRTLGNQDPLTIESIDHFSVILEDQGGNVEAEKLAREALDASTRRFGGESSQTLLAMNHLARALWYQGRYAEAEQEYRQLVEIDRRVLGPDHPQTLSAMSSLGATLFAEHRYAEAEQFDRAVLAVQRRVLGDNHQATALTLSNLAACVHAQGHLQEAEELHRETLAIRMRILGPEHAETLTTETNLADVLFGEGHFQEAEKLQRDAIAVQTREFGPDYRDTVWSQSNLAGILIREGRYAEAEAMARKAYESEVRTLGPDHDQTVDTLRNVGEAMAFEHRYPEAVNLFRDAIKQEDESGKRGNRWQNWYALACVATAANRADDAIQYLHEAIRRGYSDADGLMGEFDLNALHQNPQFRELVDSLRHSETAKRTGAYDQ
ncbi:MAG: serine/threonine-protein kinase [Terracidiphilus sp.]